MSRLRPHVSICCLIVWYGLLGGYVGTHAWHLLPTYFVSGTRLNICMHFLIWSPMQLLKGSTVTMLHSVVLEKWNWRWQSGPQVSLGGGGDRTRIQCLLLAVPFPGVSPAPLLRWASRSWLLGWVWPSDESSGGSVCLSLSRAAWGLLQPTCPLFLLKVPTFQWRPLTHFGHLWNPKPCLVRTPQPVTFPALQHAVYSSKGKSFLPSEIKEGWLFR